MVRTNFIIAVFLFLLTVGVNLSAQTDVIQDVRVSVLPLWYAEDTDTIGPVLSEVVQSTIQWTLRFISEYELVENGNYPSGQTELIEYIKNNDLDNVIYGRVDADLESMSYTISLMLLDAATDRVAAIKQGTVNSSLEIFSLADDLSISLLEEFIGRDLDFGSLSFLNEGSAGGSYEVYINDILFGEDVLSIDRFLIGEYTLRVVHKNGEDRLNVFNEFIKVDTDQDSLVTFALEPYGYVLFSRKGALVSHGITRNGKPILFPGYGEPIPLPVGNCVLSTSIPTHIPGRKFVSDSQNVTIKEGEVTAVKMFVQKPGRGIRFVNAGADGPYTVLVDGRRPAMKDDLVPVLAVGDHLVEVYQGSEALPGRLVLKQSIIINSQMDLEVSFALAEAAENVKQTRRLISDFSVEIQALANGFFWAGVNYLFLDNHAGSSLLAGYSHDGDVSHLLMELKLHGLPFKGKRLSPYLGGAFFMDTDFEDAEFFLGPNIGLTLNTGWNVISSVFLETGLFYSFSDERMHFRFCVGARLF